MELSGIEIYKPKKCAKWELINLTMEFSQQHSVVFKVEVFKSLDIFSRLN